MKLGRSLVFKLLDMPFTSSETSETSILVDSILSRGSRRIGIDPSVRVPVVGLGAPAAVMMKDAVVALGGSLTVPDHGDVANAVGAVTSRVVVSETAEIVPTSTGDFRITGVDHPHGDFSSVDEAEDAGVVVLVDEVRRRARRAGTTEDRVEMTVETILAKTMEGSDLFLGRRLEARIVGPPDGVVKSGISAG
jgi:hypothetical protein